MCDVTARRIGRTKVVAQFTACVMQQAAGSGFIGAKSVGQPAETARIERDDVEAARRQLATPRGEEMLCRPHQPCALSCVDARGRLRKLSAAPRPHLDEDEHPAFILHHEIDLAATTRHVARNETQTPALQIVERVRLERISERF
jgi:hypothetical protein